MSADIDPIGPQADARPLRRRVFVLGLVAFACMAAAAAYLVLRARHVENLRSGGDGSSTSSAGAASASGDASSAMDEGLVRRIAALRAAPHLVFLEPRSRARPRLAFAPLTDLEHGRIVTPIEAERVYAAGDRIVCLGTTVDADGEKTQGAFVLDETLRVQRTIPLVGIPSRVRASRDGNFAAVTLFVSGDSYAGNGFSTRTYVFDVAGRAPVLDLERMHATHGGMTIDSPDLNYWGVTFDEPASHFFVTLRSGGVIRLLDASFDDQTAHTIRPHVECPSLSPDRKRLAYKRLREELPQRWAIATLDLAANTERIVAGEQRSVDDQVEWIDDHRVLYSMPKPDDFGGVRADLWVLDVDSREASKLFLAEAQSPSVVRP